MEMTSLGDDLWQVFLHLIFLVVGMGIGAYINNVKMEAKLRATRARARKRNARKRGSISNLFR